MPVNRKKGSPRYGKRYRVGRGGAHIYKIGGRRIVIGGKRPPGTKPDPFAAEVESATALRYGEKERQIGSERRISEQAERNAGSWWGNYQQELAAAEQRANQGYQQATGQIQGQANLSHQQDTQADAARLAEANRSAALRGTTASEGDAGQAASARRALSNAMAGKVAFEGANQAAYGARATATGAGIRGLKLGEEQARRRQIEKAMRELTDDKGQFKVDYRTKLKDAAHKQRLENAAFGLRAADTAADNALAGQRERRQAADTRTDNRRQSATERRQQRKDERDMAKDDYQRKYGLGPYKPAAPTGGKGPRSVKGYGRTNVSLSVGLTNRRKWVDLVANSKQWDAEETAKALKKTGFLGVALKEYARNKGKGVSPKTARRVFSTYGFRIRVVPSGVGKGVKRGARGKTFSF